MDDSNETPTPTDQELLKDYLAQRDEPCPLCDYNLRGLEGDACPECGKALLLRVGLREPNLGVFVAGIVALASATGFHVLLLGYVLLTMLFISLRGFGMGVFILTNVLGAIISGVALYAWIKNGRRVRRMTSSRRRLLGASTFIVPIISLIIFFWIMKN